MGGGFSAELRMRQSQAMMIRVVSEGGKLGQGEAHQGWQREEGIVQDIKTEHRIGEHSKGASDKWRVGCTCRKFSGRGAGIHGTAKENRGDYGGGTGLSKHVNNGCITAE